MPATDQMMHPVSVHDSLQRYATTGETSPGARYSRISPGMSSVVIRVAAPGATALISTPLRTPSSARTFMSPTTPSFAAA